MVSAGWRGVACARPRKFYKFASTTVTTCDAKHDALDTMGNMSEVYNGSANVYRVPRRDGNMLDPIIIREYNTHTGEPLAARLRITRHTATTHATLPAFSKRH